MSIFRSFLNAIGIGKTEPEKPKKRDPSPEKQSQPSPSTQHYTRPAPAARPEVQRPKPSTSADTSATDLASFNLVNNIAAAQTIATSAQPAPSAPASTPACEPAATHHAPCDHGNYGGSFGGGFDSGGTFAPQML